MVGAHPVDFRPCRHDFEVVRVEIEAAQSKAETTRRLIKAVRGDIRTCCSKMGTCRALVETGRVESGTVSFKSGTCRGVFETERIKVGACRVQTEVNSSDGEAVRRDVETC